MKLTELQEVLGDRIILTKELSNKSPEERQAELAISQTISSLAKQMINNADVILRADKLQKDGSAKNTAISQLI